MSYSILSRLEHKLYIEIKRRKLKNTSPSIIASNCNAGVILHDLGLKFNTPTVNLYFYARDFIKFVSDLDRYLILEPIEEKTDMDFPVGRLDDILIYFMHYKTFDEAKEKWEERKSRVDKNNLFIMMTDKNDCTYEDIKVFNSLPFKNKVIFTHKPYEEFECAYYMKGFEDKEEVGVLSDWKPGFWKRRYIDDFDYVSFLNDISVKGKTDNDKDKGRLK